MRQLKDLPNHDGFRFTGIAVTGERLGCIVKRRLNGLHFVARDYPGGERVPLVKLLGWEPRA